MIRLLLTLLLFCGLPARVDANHGALGFTSGAVVGALTGKDALMQATSGALGAVVAETLNDIHQAEIEAGVNTGLNDQQFNTFLHKLQEHHQFHTLVSGLTALGFGLDPTQAMVSAQVAQESNNLLAAAYGAAVGGAVVYNLAHKANLLYEGEFEEFLTEVGIEIALVKATKGLGNLAKAASKTATGQQLMAAAKPYVYKVIIQGKAFIASSADQVLQLIAKQQPQLAQVLNKQASSFSHFLQADVKAGVKVGGGPKVKVAASKTKPSQLTYNGGRQATGVAHASQPLINPDKMLRGSANNAAYVPKEVAQLMEGKTFNSFDAFRNEFWKSMAKTKYGKEFGAKNLARMLEGNAPFTIKPQYLGKQKTYQLHHASPLHNGGATYDLSNIRIVTPRYHQEILDKAFHRGLKK